jgi:hypothetical protein
MRQDMKIDLARFPSHAGDLTAFKIRYFRLLGRAFAALTRLLNGRI